MQIFSCLCGTNGSQLPTPYLPTKHQVTCSGPCNLSPANTVTCLKTATCPNKITCSGSDSAGALSRVKRKHHLTPSPLPCQAYLPEPWQMFHGVSAFPLNVRRLLMTELIEEDSLFCLTRAITRTMIGPCPRSAWLRRMLTRRNPHPLIQ